MTYAQAYEQYQGERDAAVKGLDEVGGLLRAKGWDDEERKPLAEDPRRLVSHVLGVADVRTRR
jgi:hypothetical protein